MRRFIYAMFLSALAPATGYATAANLQVTGTDMVVINENSVAISGHDLAGVILEIADVDGTMINLRIDSAEPDPLKRDRWLYNLSVLGRSGNWQPFCDPGPDGLSLAFPIAGTVGPDGSFSNSSTKFTFSCTAGALAKCIRFGYAPWGTSDDGTFMLDHFRACTRMVRADYCGNGEPHTRAGTLINI